MHISCTHTREDKYIVDLASREFQDSHEWMLSLEVFKYLVELFQLPNIDMFASRLPKYASWMPNRESYIIDCVSISNENTYIYLFPPFSMI